MLIVLFYLHLFQLIQKLHNLDLFAIIAFPYLVFINNCKAIDKTSVVTIVTTAPKLIFIPFQNIGA